MVKEIGILSSANFIIQYDLEFSGKLQQNYKGQYLIIIKVSFYLKVLSSQQIRYSALTSRIEHQILSCSNVSSIIYHLNLIQIFIIHISLSNGGMYIVINYGPLTDLLFYFFKKKQLLYFRALQEL
ncbi:hypothetical protein pb186bvf_017089 [Paramecium bursaria]